MARPRTPTNILEMRGAFKQNPQRARPDEPIAVGEVGPPPGTFTPAQVSAWNDLVSRCHAGVLCHADSLAVEIAAVLLADFRASPGDMPASKLSRLDSMLSRFGMTPADRSKVSAPKPERVNPFTELVKKQRP